MKPGLINIDYSLVSELEVFPFGGLAEDFALILSFIERPVYQNVGQQQC
jgi:hypothetical protein